MRIKYFAFILILFISVPNVFAEETIRIISFNVEHGFKPDADLETIATQMETYENVDLWGLSEVKITGWEDRLTQAAANAGNATFVSFLGTKSTDRLLLVYNSDKFGEIERFELLDIHQKLGARPPLVLHLRLKTSGTEFLFMVNHLHRGASDKRSNQARALNSWARGQTLPIIAVGDYNFDWNLSPFPPYHDKGFDLMTESGIFSWVRPDFLIKTQCSEKFNSVLDFAFVAGPAQNWRRESFILETQSNYCPDTTKKSDHRPVLLEIEVP